MTVDRRRSPRIEMLDRVHGHVSALNVSVTVREMSLGGMSIETSFAVPVGAVHEFRLRMGDESDVILRGRVMRCDARSADDGTLSYTSGIQFIDDDSADADDVGGLLDRMK